MQIKSFGAAFSVALCSAATFAQSAPVTHADAPANAALKDADVHMSAKAASGANSFTEAQARDRIAKGGLTNISDLVKNKDGIWQGTATKNGKKVHVALDYKGNVTVK